MCGLVGYIGAKDTKAETAFKEMLIMDVVRGPHSTGTAFASFNGNVEVVKKAGLPHSLFEQDKFRKAMNRWHDCYMGHNRWATVGKVTTENAHPFFKGTVVGMHNGTLRGKHLLKDYQKFDTDSEALFHTIDQEGIEKAWSLTNGAAALVWWDLKEKNLNFLRNHERTLFYARTEDGKGMFWASEPWILQAAAARNNIKLDKTFFVEEQTQFCISIEDGKINIKKFARKPYVAPTYTVKYEMYGEDWPTRDKKIYEHGRSKATNPLPVESKSSSVSTKKFVPVDGDTYEFIPFALHVLEGKHAKHKWKLELRFKNSGEHRAFVFIDKDDQYDLLKYVANSLRLNHPIEEKHKSQFSSSIFKAPCHCIFDIQDKTKFNSAWLRPEDIEIVLPVSTIRTCGKYTYTMEAFDKRYKDCMWCAEPLDFCDPYIAFSNNGHTAVCGVCANSFDEEKYGYSINECLNP